MEVKQIEAKDTYKIRNDILRPGQSIKDCVFKGDDDEMSFHLGAFIDNELTSVASFFMQKSKHFDDEYQYRLRGMATMAQFQGRGLSKALLQTAFNLIKRNNVKLLWCNARKSAEGFYLTAGFEKVGEYFEIEGIGSHIVMFKKI